MIVFSLHKFYQYTFGCKVKIFTDHKPLQAIVKKPLSLPPKRLQGMILKTQQYVTDTEYQPGEKMFRADLWSRAYLEDVTSSDSYDYIRKHSKESLISSLRVGQRTEKIYLQRPSHTSTLEMS